MTKPEGYSRRDFLQGRAAVRLAAEKAQAMLDSAAELLEARLTTDSTATAPVVHVHASRRAMACEFVVQYHEDNSGLAEQVLAAFDQIERIEDQLTIYRDHSKVREINRQAADSPVEVDDDFFALLQQCQQMHRDTEGAFDITSGPLSRAWGFLQRTGRQPTPEEIEAARTIVGGEKMLLDADSKTLQFSQPGLEINFNAIGKGYALDRAAAILDEAGHTDYLWHGGGSSVLARGVNRSSQEQSQEQSWTVGLRHPLQPQRRLAEFHLRDRALATAGGATQFFEHEGRQFSHILDPRTGWPAEGTFSATVLAPTAALADGLATAFFVMRVDAVKKYCARHPEIAAVLVCPASKQSSITLHAFGMLETDWTRSTGTADC